MFRITLEKESLLALSYEGLSNNEEMLEDFREKNKTSVKLSKQSPTEYEYEVISKSEIDKLFDQGKKEAAKCDFCLWGAEGEPLHKKYPETFGLTKFSKVGFTANKEFAIVFIDTSDADKDRTGFFKLRKVDDKWTILTEVVITNVIIN